MSGRAAPETQNLAFSRRDAVASTWNDNGLQGVAVVEELYFEEANQGAAGSYTGRLNLPKGAVLIDIIVYAEALWNDGTSASLEVGDYSTAGSAVDADGFFTSVDVKATDLTVEQSIRLSGNLATAGGVGGAYTNVGTNTHLTDIFFPSGGQIVATIAAGAGTGTAGKTHVVVVWALPIRYTATFAAS